MDKLERGFFIVYGTPGKVEFDSLAEALRYCQRVNGAGVWDAKVGTVFLNKGFLPEKGMEWVVKKTRNKIRKLEMAVYILSLVLIGLILALILNVR